MNDKLKIVTNYKIPKYGTAHSAGIDLFCENEDDIVVKPNDMVKVGTGLKVQIPEGFFGGIYPRSSTGVKKNLMLANTVGIIDSDYRGEIMLFFYNFGDKTQIIKKGDRLAQLIIEPYKRLKIEVVDTLDETDRGHGGFGSTGI